MIYIRKINGDVVQLGGQVATDAMIADGWFEYDGPIPSSGTDFMLVDGVLTAYTPVKPDGQLYVEYREYLTNTDHKMYADYEPKPGEDLKAIIDQRKVARDFVRKFEANLALITNPMSDNTGNVS